MRSAIVIPARYGSTRLPGKPLLRSTGKFLIQHVYEQALQARRSTHVIVATDDSRIVAAVESFGGTAVLTRKEHPSGTDRVAEVAQKLDVDIIVNLQGDEPLIDPNYLDRVVELLQHDPQAQLATLAVPISSTEVYRSPNCVKVVTDDTGRALYFSRSPIPMVRDGEPNFRTDAPRFLHHLGLYAYRRTALLQLAQLPVHPLETLEKLEQLRALAAGWRIQVGVVAHGSPGVDTLDDYERFVRDHRQKPARWRPAA